MSLLVSILDKGILPDFLLRFGISANCFYRLREQKKENLPDFKFKSKFIDEIKNSAIALVPEKANEQHYEVTSDFFPLCLGKHLKYSSAYWGSTTRNLDEAEEKMLSLYCERGEFQDGQSVLELGCGWGSLSLFLAAKYPNSKITSVSNSASQKLFIESKAKERGINNLTIITRDMNSFNPEASFDRIVSIEMFEHMRNWDVLFKKVGDWLNPNGKFFLHIFTHRSYAYPYVDKDASDWMARYFFSGGMMPSDDLPLYFQEKIQLEQHWMLDGTHYEKTARAWLDKLDANKTAVISIFNKVYGQGEGSRWYHRWRLFYMACEMLFGYAKGSEWGVSHYRFAKR